MAIALIDGPAVKVQLEALGLSIADFARYARMERADVSRALHGHPQQPATLFRIAQALDELQRERARSRSGSIAKAVRRSVSSPAAALAGSRADLKTLLANCDSDLAAQDSDRDQIARIREQAMDAFGAFGEQSGEPS
jgi:transcriptional regulator with XRE-family HTH domain